MLDSAKRRRFAGENADRIPYAVFELPPHYRAWALMGLFGTMAMLLSAVIVGMMERDPVILGLALVLLGGLALVGVRVVSRAVDQAEVWDDALRVRTFFGRRRELAWGEIHAVRTTRETNSWTGPATLLRLVPRGGGKEILLSDRLRGFEHLSAEIRARASRAEWSDR